MGSSRSCWNSTTCALQQEEITSKKTIVLHVYYQQKCPYEKSLETYRMHLVSQLFRIQKFENTSTEMRPVNMFTRIKAFILIRRSMIQDFYITKLSWIEISLAAVQGLTNTSINPN